MISIICDKCKKPIKNAVRDDNYRVICNHNLCSKCYDDTIYDLKEKMLSKDNYEFMNYKDELSKYLKKECS